MKSLRNQLKKGEVLLGLSVHYPSAGAVERIGGDWDWIWIDGQHGLHDYRSLLSCVRACNFIERPSVVRVPGLDYGAIGRVLDTGADGVMVPMISSTEQARAAVQAAKFPPQGERSFGGRRPIDLSGRSYAHTANEDTILIVQIETKEGLSNVQKIAEVPGVDLLFFSPDDMAMQDSMPMDTPRDLDVFKEGMEILASTAKKAGKLAGTVTASPEKFQMAVKMGYSLCVATSDVGLLAESSAEKKAEMDSVRPVS